ncbi:MAG: tetratricopeptide repeat protein [Myxococcaceae bacterium]|nr:tetratricopeptide repeat protein [Myxococcaceae bacterium]
MADKSEKLSRKELKAPDEFQKLGAQAVPWLEHNGPKVAMGVAVAVVGFGVMATINYMGSRGQHTAQGELGSALKVLGRDVNANAVSDGGPDAPFKTEAEREAALIDSLNKLRGANKGNTVAASAALPLGQALLRQGKADEALPLFDEYLSSAAPADPLRSAALEGKGYAFESKKDYEKALAAFEQLSRENKTDFMKGMGLYHRARVLLEQGKTDEGARQLSEISNAAPGSAAARLAAERIALLTSQGVKVPAPSISVDAGH